MQKKVLIVGSGIAGINLAFTLLKNNIEFKLVDCKKPIDTTSNKHGIKKIPTKITSSNIAPACLQPINFTNYNATPNYKFYLAQALEQYSYVAHVLETTFVIKKNTISYNNYEKYISKITQLEFIENFDSELFSDHCFSIKPKLNISNSYIIQANLLLMKAYNFFEENNYMLPAQTVTEESLEIVSSNEIIFQHEKFSHVVFCTGNSTIIQAYFDIPFVNTYGFASILKIDNLSTHYIHQYNLKLVPIQNNLWWCGSNFLHIDEPTYNNFIAWKQYLTEVLSTWLSCSYTVESTWFANRPATVGQKTYALQHPTYKNVFAFTGLGTKGFLTAPTYAQSIVEAIASA